MGVPARDHAILGILGLLFAVFLWYYFADRRRLRAPASDDPHAEMERAAAAPGHWRALAIITGAIILLAFVWPAAFDRIIDTIIEFLVGTYSWYEQH